MKERIEENHPWVTDDEENTEEIKQIENKLSKHLLKTGEGMKEFDNYDEIWSNLLNAFAHKSIGFLKG